MTPGPSALQRISEPLAAQPPTPSAFLFPDTFSAALDPQTCPKSQVSAHCAPNSSSPYRPTPPARSPAAATATLYGRHATALHHGPGCSATIDGNNNNINDDDDATVVAGACDCTATAQPHQTSSLLALPIAVPGATTATHHTQQPVSPSLSSSPHSSSGTSPPTTLATVPSPMCAAAPLPRNTPSSSSTTTPSSGFQPGATSNAQCAPLRVRDVTMDLYTRHGPEGVLHL